MIIEIKCSVATSIQGSLSCSDLFLRMFILVAEHRSDGRKQNIIIGPIFKSRRNCLVLIWEFPSIIDYRQPQTGLTELLNAFVSFVQNILPTNVKQCLTKERYSIVFHIYTFVMILGLQYRQTYCECRTAVFMHSLLLIVPVQWKTNWRMCSSIGLEFAITCLELPHAICKELVALWLNTLRISTYNNNQGLQLFGTQFQL